MIGERLFHRKIIRLRKEFLKREVLHGLTWSKLSLLERVRSSSSIIGAIFCFWWMWTSGSVMNVQMRVHQLEYTHDIHNSSTHSHPSEEENRSKNRSENRKCKRALTEDINYMIIWTETEQQIVVNFRNIDGNLTTSLNCAGWRPSVVRWCLW
jgi:hypothetical protein